MFVNLQIKSKNKNSLSRFTKLLLKLTNIQGLKLKNISRYFIKKSKRKIFTILQSPHVNKKSQEQFEYNFKVIQLNLNSFQFFKVLIVLKKIQKILGFDISIVVKFIINPDSKKRSILNSFKYYKYKTIFYDSSSVKCCTFKKYLSFLDVYGKFCFNLFK